MWHNVRSFCYLINSNPVRTNDSSVKSNGGAIQVWVQVRDAGIGGGGWGGIGDWGEGCGGLLWVSGLWRKIGNFTYGMADRQGKIAMDGDFRSHKAGCRRLRPVRFEIPTPIPLVKSDLKTRPETQSRPPQPSPQSPIPPHPPPPIPASRT